MKAILFVAAAATMLGCLLSLSATEARQPAPIAEVDWDRVLRRGDTASVQSIESAVAATGSVDLDLEYKRGSGSVSGGVVADPDDGTVRIEILHSQSSDAIRGVVLDAGGEVYGEVPGVLAEARVPATAIGEIEATAGVSSVRAPIQQAIPLTSGPILTNVEGLQESMAFTGEEIAKTNADEWHDAGISGAGTRVGIIDFFDGALWDDAQAAGELPEPSGTFCLILGESCDLWDAGAQHGVAVGEIIHEMAPSAELYVATVYSTADTQAAVDYFASVGVDVISRSLTSEYDGPGDGTGPLASVMDSAVDQGMLWVNAAGNSSGVAGERDGSHWRGAWNNPDGDDWLNFDGDNELVGFVCGFINGLRWNDWAPAGRTDYDLVIYDTPISPQPKAFGAEDQPAGAPPLEHVNDSLSCAGPLDIDYIGIALFDPGAGTAGDTLEFMGNQTIFSDWNNPYSASGPGSDSTNPGALSVGAVDPAVGTTIADYSSQGPTWDGRVKPDLSAASCVAGYAYSPDCFNGTSAAAPVVSGAAALVLSSGVAGTPAEVAAYLKGAVVDRGAGGADNVFGTGELLLPSAPDQSTNTPTATPQLSPPPGPTNTPTPTAGPTDAPTASPTGGAGFTLAWSDADCDGEMTTRDNQSLLRVLLGQNRLSQTQPCVPLGDDTIVEGRHISWGDSDCDGEITTRDNQSIMRVLLGQNRLSQTEPCPDVGEEVLLP